MTTAKTTAKITTISRKSLVEKLLTLRGASFITVTTTTDSRAKKTNNPYGKIYKTAVANCQVNFHYDTAVLNRLAKEGKDASVFERGESWHEPYKPDGILTPLCVKKGETEPEYLRVRHLLAVGEPVYTTEDGTELTEEEVRPFLPKPSEYKNQGTDEPIKFLVYSLSSIKIIKMGGDTYFVA